MGARLGWGEVVLILIIALIVLGPDKLPQAGRALGKAVRGVKKYIHEATQELEEFDELKDIKEDVEGIQKDLKTMGRNLEKSVSDDMDELEKDVKTASEEIQTAVEKEPEAKPTPASEDDETDAGNDNESAGEADMNTQEET